MPAFLSEIIIIIIAAFLGGFVARTIKLPPVLGYIVSGIVFGIIGRNFFQEYEALQSISEFGVSLLLFTLGFEIPLDIIKKIDKKIFIVGIIQILLCVGVYVPIFTLLFGIALNVSILFGVLFSFSSTAVAIKILEEKGLLHDFPGNNIFVLLLVQDLFVVPLIFLLPLLFGQGGVSDIKIVEFLVSCIKPLLIFVGILVLSKLFLSKILDFLFRYPSHELTILATIFTATISILLFASVGVPASIAAFLAGVLISEQGKNLTPLAEIRPFRDLFLVLFFVLTGMLLSFNFFVENIWLIVLLSAFVLIAKFGITYLVLRVFRYSPSGGVFISSYLTNVGEFAIVIGQIAFVSAFINSSEYNLVLSVFILSLLTMPLLLALSRSGGERMARLGLLSKILPEDNIISSKTEIYKNHVVICGHGRVGRQVCGMLDLAGIPYIVIDFNRKVINDLLKASKYGIYGDPTDVDILKAAFIDRAKSLVIAVPDGFSQKRIITTALKQNPKISILCRSHVESDRYDLINMGVNSIVVPEFEAGIRMGGEVLDIFSVRKTDSASYAEQVRRRSLV